MKTSDMFKEGAQKTGSFASGFMANFSSLGLLSKHKSLIVYFIIPFLINIFLLLGIFYFSYSSIYPFLNDLLAGDSWILNVLRWILVPILIMALAIMTVLLYSITGNIITAPFNDFLSYSIEVKEANLTFDEPFSMKVLIADIVRITLNILKMLVILIVINLFLLVLNFIPVIGSILYSILSFMASTFFFGFQFFDFPLERRRFDFKQKLKIAWRYKFMTMGLGTGFMVVTFIPILGFLGLNMSTMGATVLFLEHIRPTLKLTANEQALLPGDSSLS